MSTIITEIAFVPLRPGINIDDESSPDGKKWKSIVNSSVGIPGSIGAYVGHQVDSPDMIMHLLDWESLESHENFIKHPAYLPMMVELESLQHGDGSFYHAHLRSAQHPSSTSLTQMFQSGVPAVTELRTFHFAIDISSSDSSAFERTFFAFCCKALGKAEGLSCMAGGWVVEEVDNREIPGGKAKAFSIVAGWESVEKHTAFRGSEVYNLFPGFEAQAKRSEVRAARLVPICYP